MRASVKFELSCTVSRNNSNSAFIAGGGITASCVLEWYPNQDIQSVFSKCCFLRLAITASSHFHSSFLPSLTAGKLESCSRLLMGPLNSLVLKEAGSALVYF